MLFAALYGKAADTLRFSVYFDTDRSQPVSDIRLPSVLVPGTPVLSIELLAYCDDRGSEGYNKALARRRAETVRKRLRSFLPDPNISWKLIPEGELPLTSGDTIEVRRKHRRVDVRILVNKETLEEENLPGMDLTQAKVGDKLVLKNLLFVGGHHVLLPESHGALEELFRQLEANPTLHIKIIGHVCCTNGEDGVDLGTGEPNLSVTRAKAVLDYLVAKGIKAKRLSYEGRAGRESTGLGAKEDRRVEIEIISR